MRWLKKRLAESLFKAVGPAKGANFAMCTYFRVKASHGVVASCFAALAAVLERPGSRTAVCPDATAQVSRAEL